MAGLVDISNYFANILSGGTPGGNTPAPKKPAPKKKEPTARAKTAMKELERNRVLPRLPGQDFTDSFASAVGNTFGIAPRIAALVVSASSGRPYDEVFDEIQAQEQLKRDKSVAGNIAGSLYGGGGAGAVASSVVRGGGSALVRAGAPRIGQAITGLTKLQRGQRIKNVGKLIVGGTAGGAAQAAGEGSDVGTGAAIGAVAAPAVVGTLKGLRRVLELPWSAVGGSAATSGIIRRLTNTTSEELAQRAAARRQETGMEPTVFELLSAKDQQRIMQDVVGPNADVGDDAARLMSDRLQEVGGGMQSRVQQITQPRQQRAEQEIAGRLATARGAPDPNDPAFAAQAARSPETMERLRTEEAGAIMAPFDNQIAVGSLDDLIPQVPVQRRGGVSYQPDPEATAVLRSVAGFLKNRGANGITVGEITRLRQTLRGLANRGDINSGPAQAALDHIDDLMGRQMPDAADAIARMDEAYAGASRMAEGMQEGAQTRLRNVPGRVGTSDRESQLVRNAYDTPEGETGRAVGQINRLEDTFNPNAQIGDIQRGLRGVQRDRDAIAANIGQQESEAIAGAAQELDDSVRSLSRALRSSESAGAGADDIDALVDAFTIGNPASFPTAKAWALRRLVNATPFPEARARDVVNMLFSRDPQRTRQALGMLNSTMKDARSFRRDLGLALSIGSNAERMGTAEETPVEGAPVPTVEEVPAQTFPTDEELNAMSDEELAALEQELSSDYPTDAELDAMSDEELAQLEQDLSVPFGRSAVLEVFPDAVITDDLRDPNSPLGRANPGSYHNKTDGAVDVRPIPGKTFNEFISELKAAGYDITEAIDETKKPSRHATGPHWHVVMGPKDQLPTPMIKGNLPLGIRYKVKNPDGSVSTVRTMSIGVENGEVLIPTVIDGRVVSDKEAIDHYYQTGENFGTFKTPNEATAYAKALHQKHEKELRK